MKHPRGMAAPLMVDLCIVDRCMGGLSTDPDMVRVPMVRLYTVNPCIADPSMDPDMMHLSLVAPSMADRRMAHPFIVDPSIVDPPMMDPYMMRCRLINKNPSALIEQFVRG